MQLGRFSMKILLVVNSSPWGSSLGVTALRFARAAIAEGVTISAVFFREEGVFHARPGQANDAGTPGLTDAWVELAQSGMTRLLVCSSSGQRNLGEPPAEPFHEAGLAEMLALMSDSDRVVSW